MNNTELLTRNKKIKKQTMKKKQENKSKEKKYIKIGSIQNIAHTRIKIQHKT